MSLPARQQHRLDQIEKGLEAADPKLIAMFAAFTKVTVADVMPAREVIRNRLPQVLLIGLMALTVVSAVLLGSLLGSPRCSRATPTSRVAHMASITQCQGSSAPSSSGH